MDALPELFEIEGFQELRTEGLNLVSQAYPGNYREFLIEHGGYYD